MKRFLLIILPTLLLVSCSVDPQIKPELPAEGIKEVIPEGWPEPHYRFTDNTLTTDRFILGRALFYEPMFSLDNTVSCGSCHQQFAAFAHSGHQFSHGIDGRVGTRNAPALQNLAWNPSFMHDGGVNHIEVFPPAPITNTVEMAETLPNVVQKIGASFKYQALFRKAYGDDTVTTQRMFKAIAQFMGTMYSYNSKYDRMKQGSANFTASEQSGYSLFVQKCASCHQEPLFSDYKFRNNGLMVNQAIRDSGRAHITRDPADIYKFKTPSLRNIDLTAPYMHDGRYMTLMDCLNHYTSSITLGPTLDPSLSGGIQMSTQEKTDIIAFLKTLTDQQFLTDKRYSEITP
jgi:cytochrome c peroxidase